jgi:hypothetical protein
MVDAVIIPYLETIWFNIMKFSDRLENVFAESIFGVNPHCVFILQLLGWLLLDVHQD